MKIAWMKHFASVDMYVVAKAYRDEWPLDFYELTWTRPVVLSRFGEERTRNHWSSLGAELAHVLGKSFPLFRWSSEGPVFRVVVIAI